MKRLTVSALVVATSVLGCNHGLPISLGSPDLGSQAPGNCNLTINNGPPVTVAGWCVSSPGRMVVDHASVTVVSQAVVSHLGTLVRIDKARGAQTILVGKAGDPSLDGTLADGGAELFFAACDTGQHCSIFAVPRAGGALRTVAASDASVVNTYHKTFDLAVDAANVYWLTDGIWSAPRAGGVAKRLGDGVGANDRFAGIAVDTSAVYATRPSAGVVIRQPLDGSAATTLATGQVTPSRIAVAGGTIYWLASGTAGTDCSSSDGAIHAWSSGSERSLATGLDGASDFAVVGGKLVYAAVGRFCNDTSTPLGSIEYLSLPAGAPVEVANAQLLPGNVASDGTDVYWTVVSGYDGTGAIVHAALR